MNEPQYRGMQRREPRREARVPAIHRQRVLHEVVRSDAEERHLLRQRIRGDHRRGRLDHDAERNVGAMRHAAVLELARRFGQQGPGLAHFVDGDDERQHDAHVAVHRGAHERAQLRPEELRLVEAHANGAPAEERIRLVRIPPHRELVAAHVERADHHGLSAERLDDVRVGLVLLLLVRHRRAADDEELGAHQADALGAAQRGARGLLRQVHVHEELDPNAVHRDRLLAGEPGQHLALAPLAARPRRRVLELGGRRTHDEHAGRGVEDHFLTAREARGRVEEPDDRGKPERAREDGDVRRAGARVRRDARDALAIELQREARREVVRDEDRVGALRQVHRIVVGEVEQDGEHADVHVHQVAHALAHHRVRRSREVLAPFEHHHVERAFR